MKLESTSKKNLPTEKKGIASLREWSNLADIDSKKQYFLELLHEKIDLSHQPMVFEFIFQLCQRSWAHNIHIRM